VPIHDGEGRPEAEEGARMQAGSDFEGRRAIVTGAAAGIGRAIALRLARAGAQVACLDVDAKKLERTASELAAAVAAERRDANGAGGARIVPLVADVSSESATRSAVDEAVAAMGGLDVLVNNAGIVILQRFDETPVEDWDRTFAINLRSMFLMARAALPALRQSGAGAIVNIASIAAYRYTVPHVPYATAKAVELAPDRIRVNAVAPGPIATEMLGKLTDDELGRAGRHYLLGRLGKPDDIAEAVAFLASERASYVTGATLPVTGGAELASRPVRSEDR
jgi:NAD(P)-dependent dehydrogenase (short-subunit alcohol dehydrogenase family)